MKITPRDLVLTSLFTALMIAGAFIRIPFPLLPITLQAFICALSGLVLGARLAALSMTVYTLLGLAGLPVFANGGGITYVFNKSFGFIIGFIAGAAIIGKISSIFKKPSVSNNLKALLAGLAVIYTIGIAYMLLIMRVYLGNEKVGLILIISSNIPYMIKDIVLFTIAAIAGASLLPAIKSVLRAAK